MLHPAFVKAAKGVRSRLGLNALFAGAHTTKATFEQGIEVSDGEGNVTVAQYVVGLDKAIDPKRNDTLVFIDANNQPISDESYVLDTLLSDNGAHVRFIVRKA